MPEARAEGLPVAIASCWERDPLELIEEVALTDVVLPAADPVDYAVLEPRFAFEVAVAWEAFSSEG